MPFGEFFSPRGLYPVLGVQGRGGAGYLIIGDFNRALGGTAIIAQEANPRLTALVGFAVEEDTAVAHPRSG